MRDLACVIPRTAEASAGEVDVVERGRGALGSKVFFLGTKQTSRVKIYVLRRRDGGRRDELGGSAAHEFRLGRQETCEAG